MKSLFASALVAILTISCSSVESASTEVPVEPETVQSETIPSETIPSETVEPLFICRTPEEVTVEILYQNQTLPNTRVVELDSDALRIFSYNWNRLPPPTNLPMDKVITFYFPNSQQVMVLISSEGCVRAVDLWSVDKFLSVMEDTLGI
jgi:hypothetical protein